MTLYAIAWNFYNRLFSCNNVLLCLCAFGRMFLCPKDITYVIFLVFSEAHKNVSHSFHRHSTVLCKSISSVALALIFQICLRTSPLLDYDLLEEKGAEFINHCPSAWHMICGMHSKIKNGWFNQLLLIPPYSLTPFIYWVCS